MAAGFGCFKARAGIQEVHFLPFNPTNKRTALTYIDSEGKMHQVSKVLAYVLSELNRRHNYGVAEAEDDPNTKRFTHTVRVEHLLRDVKDTTISTLATEDDEGLIVLNIGSYMSGVDLW